MIERFFLYRVNAKAAGPPITEKFDLVLFATANKAQATLPFP